MPLLYLFLPFLLLGLLSGCSSVQEQSLAFHAQQQIMKMQQTALTNTQPSLEVKCGTSIDSCKGLAIKFIHPADRHKLIVPHVRTTNDVISDSLPHLKDVLMFGFGAFAATRIVDDVMSGVGGGNTTTHNTTAINGDGNNTTATTSVSKSSHDGDQNSTSSSVDNDSAVDSYNATDDNSVVSTTNTDNSVNNTHDPLVVTQPAPVIVPPSYPPNN